MLIEGSLTPVLDLEVLADDKGSLKSQSFKQLELTQLERHDTVNIKSKDCSPGVADSIPVRGNFLLNLFLL